MFGFGYDRKHRDRRAGARGLLATRPKAAKTRGATAALARKGAGEGRRVRVGGGVVRQERGCELRQTGVNAGREACVGGHTPPRARRSVYHQKSVLGLEGR